MDENARKLVFAGTGLAVILAAGITLYLFQSSEPERESADMSDDAEQSWLAAWSTDGASDIDIASNQAGVPGVALAESELALGPAELNWQTTRRGASTVITGTHDALPQVSWEFADGNPTAIFRAQQTVSPDALVDPVTVALELPDGELEGWTANDGFHAVDAYSTSTSEYPWLRWTRGEDTLTFRGWNGDGFAVRPTESGSFTVELSLWRPGQHSRIVECLGELGDDTIELRARAAVEFRRLPKMVAWPYPDGAEAMMLPVLIAPELHADPQLADAKSRNPGDFAERVTTLAYGHSSAQDPRYGNGGLLGHGLGGTVVAPKRMLGKKKVQALARNLAPTRVNIAAGAAPPDDSPYDVRFAGEVGCDLLRNRDLLSIVTPAPEGSERVVSRAPNPFVTQLSTRMLDGRLDSLLAQGFSRAFADQALRERGIYTFASPLVATRNPLVGAAADALLEPERDGMWTVSPRLAGGLADVELWREEHPIGVSSVHDLMAYWSFRDRAAVVWSEDGAPQLGGAEAESQVGYTIALDGEAELPEALEPPPRVRVVETANGPVTLLSWDAAPDTSSLALERDLGDTSVNWNVSIQND